ncbi:MAG: glycogen synthase [Bacteroidetes bacterium MedPE-SWsnd-G1]|uniref:starch synthase n=1 Tax=Urechidicola vernalis TaxID=3075600 RepID=A0ABU2Y635_9FLAO|nr:glycogen/starch synthase [Urechidicola sp. P050]MDT0553669.1 glycogen/starch synthase [Urechidicola sp. P050]OIQ40306.1 MAG: glycogen synthase [Bacteroidetes bacterium MedPE-SWsnd-G1]
MKDKKVLYVSSEVVPYLPETEMSRMSFESARMVHGKGGQTRIFMPRFGVINERRHQLHEVIRLSGMNLIINDIDMPLIIKVASIPKERMQVYFIDNDEYFKRKAIFTDDKGELFDDNDERMIFFAKGVVETVKKLNWAPDIIHVHGWMASLLPLYLKEYYKDDALFENSKVVTSIYNNKFDGSLNEELKQKVQFDNIDDQKLNEIDTPNFSNLLKIAIESSDAVITGSEDVDPELVEFAKSLEKPVLDFQPVDHFEDAYYDFYQTEVLQ